MIGRPQRISTVNQVAGCTAIGKEQPLAALVCEGARIECTRSVEWCGIAGYHRRRERRTDQEGEDSEERAHLVKEWKYERRQKGKKA